MPAEQKSVHVVVLSRALRGLAVVSLAVALVAGPASATVAYPRTNDQSVTIAVKRWWYTGQTSSQLVSLLSANKARLTQIRVDDPSTPTFTVSMVANSGVYKTRSWWYSGKTASQLSDLARQNKARLISIDPYQTQAGLHFAAVMVDNTGKAKRSWWFYADQSGSSLGSLLSQNDARLIALRSYMKDGNRVFAAIMIANIGGGDGTPWYWWYGVSTDFLASFMDQHDTRLISLTPDPAGGWDAVMVQSEGEGWYWWFGQTASDVSAHIEAHKTRLIEVSPYVVGGQPRYAIIELDNTNPLQSPINAASRRVQSYDENNGWGGGLHGAYFVPATKLNRPTIAYDSRFRFEPASTIKVLYLLYTMQQVQAGNIGLSDPVTYYPKPGDPDNPNVCPDPAWEIPENARTTTVLDALEKMMRISSNVMTRAFAIKWGLGSVQALAVSLGMENTHLNQAFIGCGFRGAVRNELTLVDAATLYASVENGTSLGGDARSTFFSILLGGSPFPSDAWGTVVTEEANAAGKSDVIDAFLASMDIRSKGGSYGICMWGCLPYKLDLSLAGRALIPFKDLDGAITRKAYLFGDFVNDLVLSCNTCDPQDQAYALISRAAAESARTTIRAALATW